MATRLASLGIERGAPIVAINPGATYGSAKRWYPDRFAAVADALSAEWGAAVVVVGSTAEAPLAGEIEAAARIGAVNLAGKTTVRELMALLVPLLLSGHQRLRPDAHRGRPRRPARGDLRPHRLAAHLAVVFAARRSSGWRSTARPAGCGSATGGTSACSG